MSPTSVPASAVLKPGSLILITGVTGYIGAHLADQLLLRGYKVRGVVRKPAEWLLQIFDSRYGKGNFETWFVADLTDEEALSKAMQGTVLLQPNFISTGIIRATDTNRHFQV
jgi:nucleoside-diphosphate-sugar epimerase